MIQDRSRRDDPPAHDPAIFLFIYLRRPLPTSQQDTRLNILKKFDTFADKYRLEPSVDTPYRRASEIDLKRLDTALPDFELLVRSSTPWPKSSTGTYYEALAYTYHDVLFLQLTISKYSEWTGSLVAGWDELTTLLREGYDGRDFEVADRELLGLSLVFWTVTDDDVAIDTYNDSISSIADRKGMRKTTPNFGGDLWLSDRKLFESRLTISQKVWLLLTPRSAEASVNQRFYQTHSNEPPAFAVVALALHKSEYEWEEYRKERAAMEVARTALDLQVAELVNLQRNLGPELDELRSRKGKTVQRKLAKTGAELADYQGRIGLLKELRRTLIINRRTLFINSVALISSTDAAEVTKSIDRETAASAALSRWGKDEIFGTEAGRVNAMSSQLESDIDYNTSLAERHYRALEAVRDQLQIAGQRDMGEMVHHLSIDSAAVVASVVAVIVVDLAFREDHHLGLQECWVLFFIVGAFAAVQVLSDSQGKVLERWSVSVTTGFFGAGLGLRLGLVDYTNRIAPKLDEPAQTWLIALVAGLSSACIGWWLHQSLQLALRKRR